MKSVKRLTLLITSLLLAGGQTLSSAAYANFSNIQSLNNNAAITAPINTISPTTDSTVTATFGATKQSKNYVNIEKGNVLLSQDTDICVGTREGDIHIAAGATVFLMESTQGAVIYDLSQTRPKQVYIIVDQAKLYMQPGSMAVLTRQNTQDFKALEVNCHLISYRKPQQVNMHNDAINAFMADFSIVSALTRIQPLKRLAVSDDKRDKLVLERILRGAIAMTSFAGTASPFAEAGMGR